VEDHVRVEEEHGLVHDKLEDTQLGTVDGCRDGVVLPVGLREISTNALYKVDLPGETKQINNRRLRGGEKNEKQERETHK
jgi:hypothetical protein